MQPPTEPITSKKETGSVFWRWWAWWSWVSPVTVTVVTSPAPRRLRERSLRRCVFWGLLLAIASSIWAAQLRADVDAPEEKVESKEVTGEVASVSASAISIEYSKTKQGSYEMLLPVGKETRLERLKSLVELKARDTVRVRYEQTYKEDDKGERIVLKTLATQISLVRPAPEEGALVSREQP